MLVALRLSEATEGNGFGVGLADLTTLHAIGQIDFEKTYLNALTAGHAGVRRAALPIALPTDGTRSVPPSPRVASGGLIIGGSLA